MDVQEIEVVIGPDGTARIEVRGVPGPACLELTADLEAVLGDEVTSREPTSDATAQVLREHIVDVDDRLRRQG